ncbi:hypothetical protein PSTEL_05085 [Paenibacillus stellifer]|uniref:Uncharacterized protein n=1 Tax=Paenibacillus stellifer TaxID=169760 RepID=A0A089LM05_9BACL|nr:hypothetical protein [Paenibacillus stellifer]AIQ62566.1 hypothetical protein PSTEL_05085 [Paenibacillus stellifer]
MFSHAWNRPYLPTGGAGKVYLYVPLGKQMLKQQADRLLTAAIHTDDEVLRQESERLYSQLKNFEYNSITRKQLHEQKYRQMKRKR